MLAWLSIYGTKAHILCPCAGIRMFPPVLRVKRMYLVDADLFLDIVSTILGLRRVNDFNSHCLLRVPVHQQPDPGATERLGTGENATGGVESHSLAASALNQINLTHRAIKMSKL